VSQDGPPDLLFLPPFVSSQHAGLQSQDEANVDERQDGCEYAINQGAADQDVDVPQAIAHNGHANTQGETGQGIALVDYRSLA
jgi:hypothetical protein